jgi:hypothetical protein
MGVEFRDNNGDVHNVELLDCPFCGSAPKILSIGNYHTKKRSVVVKCSDEWKCGNQGFTVAALTHDFAFCVEHAAKRWNARNTELNGVKG